MILFQRSPTLRTSSAQRGRNLSSLSIGIRREDSFRIWERRCPVTPDAVHELVHKHRVNVLVQNCERRVYPVQEFVKAGAVVDEDLRHAHIILGIKETPLSDLIISPVVKPDGCGNASRTHLMFSHTIKGQPYNMELLSRFLHPPDGQPSGHTAYPRLIDYELLTDGQGKRTVGFGWFAGVAGVLESLSAMAHSHLEIGVASPFLHTPRPHTQATLQSLRSSLRAIGDHISETGTPKSLGPFVIGLTGTGNVSQGCLSMLEELPIVNVEVQHLPALVSDPSTDLRKVYLVHALPRDYFSTVEGNPYDRTHYYAYPHLYKSEFATKIAPYLTLLLHGAGWSPSFPRLMTNEQLAVALRRARQIGKDRFLNVGDISCDVEGGLEFLKRSSTLSSPFYKSRPPTLTADLPSVQIMAVDILPASIPKDASEHFSRAVFPYLSNIIHEYRGEEMESSYASAIEKATVASHGELAAKHAWLGENIIKCGTRSNLPTSSSEGVMLAKRGGVGVLRTKKILMLGSGMVSGPAVDEICKRIEVELIVASNSLSEASSRTRQHTNARSILVHMDDHTQVSKLIADADVVISLLPVAFHPLVTEFCIQHHKHMVTASYISPAMHALHAKAIAADVLLLNEIGLDPGIDHCSAISLLNDIRTQKKQIVSFISFCGGLPAPECADSPLGYKFSWSPRGVLQAALNSARFRLDGVEWEIPGEQILTSHFPNVPVSNVLKLEGIANRDSVPYADFYGLGPAQELRSLLRGTLRYPGFSALMHSFKLLGLLDSTMLDVEHWSSLTQKSLEARLGTKIKNELGSVVSALSDVIPSRHLGILTDALQWLSLLPHPSLASSLPPLPTRRTSAIDLFTKILAHKLRYETGERDMVILFHEIVTRPMSTNLSVPNVSEEVHTSSLVTHGTPSISAMSRCVGLPVAIAALKVLDGAVRARGVVGPAEESVYRAVLGGLDENGLGMKESMRRGGGMEGVLTSGLKSSMVRVA